jgi:hypothetical protein
MKATATILLTIATITAAVPNPNADINAGMLSARQGCSYACVCQTNGEGEGPSPDTTTCCTAGTLLNGGSVCLFTLPLMSPLSSAHLERDHTYKARINRGLTLGPLHTDLL